jgi:hypothetical protein
MEGDALRRLRRRKVIPLLIKAFRLVDIIKSGEPMRIAKLLDVVEKGSPSSLGIMLSITKKRSVGNLQLN